MFFFFFFYFCNVRVVTKLYIFKKNVPVATSKSFKVTMFSMNNVQSFF